jgi:hypothetical protein
MRTTEPYASEISDKNEELTDARAVEICRAAISRQRNLTRDEHEKIATHLDLPPNMLRYLEIREEADYLEVLGSSYLGANFPKHEDILKAEAEFHDARDQITAIRPDVMMSLRSAQEEVFDELVQDKTRQYEAFQSSVAARWSPSPRLVFIILNVLLVVGLCIALALRRRRNVLTKSMSP